MSYHKRSFHADLHWWKA